MKFLVRKNERVRIYSEVFATREEAEANKRDDEHHVVPSFADELHITGYPCAGYVVLNPWRKPAELHAEAL